MKNQVHNYPQQRTTTKTCSKSKKKNSSSKLSMGLFEVKELQIQSKHDNEQLDINIYQMPKINAELVHSITPQPLNNQTIIQNSFNDDEQVKTSFINIKQDAQNGLDKATTLRNFTKENQMIEDQRSLNILLNKHDSNINYLQMQTRELLKLTHHNILCEEQKQFKSQISKLQIACRKLKISIRNNNSKGKSPATKIPRSKHEIEREKQLQILIQKQKNKSYKLKTKLLLLQNYLQKKSQENKVEQATIDPGADSNETQNCSLLLQKQKLKSCVDFPKHKQILNDRITVIKDSITLTNSYATEKVQRLVKENQILRQELQLLNFDLNKYRVSIRRGNRLRHLQANNKARSLKLLSDRNHESSNSNPSKKWSRNKSRNSYNSRKKDRSIKLIEQKKVIIVNDDYRGQIENETIPIRKKENENSEEDFQNIKKMQQYIAGEYFQQKDKSLQA